MWRIAMAECMTWTEDMMVHVDSIDRRNQALIKQLTELCQAVGNNKKDQEIKDIFRFLAAYTIEHFRDEEQLMRPGYIGAFAHKKAHADFVEEVVWYLGAMEAGEIDSRLVLWVAKKLWERSRRHITFMDRELAEFLEPKGGAEDELEQKKIDDIQGTGVGAARLIGFPGLRALKPY
jgi:hemerythrin